MDTTAATMTMATVLSTITEVFTAAVGWVGTVSETVVLSLMDISEPRRHLRIS